MGEALELLTGGRLAATPHFVSGNAAPTQEGEWCFKRNFCPVSAVCLEQKFPSRADEAGPDVDDVIGADGETFGTFTKRVLERHHGEMAPTEAES